MEPPALVATELSHLESATHGRQRRDERDIPKIDLQRARRYGMVERGHGRRLKYTYGGIVFIYDPVENREVTSWRSSDEALDWSGTKCTYPVLLEKKRGVISETQVRAMRSRIYKTPQLLKSHAVFVVDMSGSMRRDDVNGARCRSDGVWMTLARDYVRKPLENQTATAFDLVTVIVMKETANVIVYMEPVTWGLYNKLVDLREWSTVRPSGGGNYMPALDLADQLLSTTLPKSSSFPLSLFFLSDGKPSDQGDFAERMGQIASKYGRRLTVCCVGFAHDNASENFRTLHDMVTEADAFGAISSFNKPSMQADSLSNIITSMVSSMTTSKTEMSDLNTGKSKMLRTDVRRERKGTPDDLVLTNQWTAYRNSSEDNYVARIWSWDYHKNSFVNLRDNRCIFCFEKGRLKCPHCHACNYCSQCHPLFAQKHYKKKECYANLNDLRTGALIAKKVPSFEVAMKNRVFDEGAERLVHKFRFLDEYDRFIGPKMVAKESRFVESEGTYYDRMKYHESFMRTQTLAARFAEYFNAALDDLVHHFHKHHHDWIRELPRIIFLEPLVVEVVQEDGTELNILIEPQLEGKYEKFNNNMGYVKGQKQPVNDNDMENLLHSLNQLKLDMDGEGARALHIGNALCAIEEGSEDEEEESDDDGDEDEDDGDEAEGIDFDKKESVPEAGEYGDVHPKDFPQAFSHYTYEKSKQKLMVVDLQGMYQKYDDGTSEYILTDPVIHKRKGRRRSKQLENWKFGRTDRNEKGMDTFFRTHKCSGACRLLGLTEKSAGAGIPTILFLPDKENDFR